MALLASFPILILDRPFGVHLWPYLNKGFELVAGYPADGGWEARCGPNEHEE